MADVFEEVEGQLRSARYQSLIEKGWPYGLAALVLAVLVTLGVWGWGQHQTSEQATASLGYAKGLEALSAGDLEGADRHFASLAASAPAGYRALSLMQQAGVRVSKTKPDEAARLLDQAAKVAPDDILGDAARLKAALLLMDSRPIAEIEARLIPLTGEKRPYRMVAREALAMARLQAGKIPEARGDFAVLSLAQDVSDAARARAKAALDMIASGSASAIPAAAKLAAKTPASPPAAQVGAAQ